MSMGSPSRGSSSVDQFTRMGSSGRKESHSSSFYSKSPTKPKRLQSAHLDDITGNWRCKNCGFTYTHPEPHHHVRREHKKICPGAVTYERWTSQDSGRWTDEDSQGGSQVVDSRSSAPKTPDTGTSTRALGQEDNTDGAKNGRRGLPARKSGSESTGDPVQPSQLLDRDSKEPASRDELGKDSEIQEVGDAGEQSEQPGAGEAGEDTRELDDSESHQDPHDPHHPHRPHHPHHPHHARHARHAHHPHHDHHKSDDKPGSGDLEKKELRASDKSLSDVPSQDMSDHVDSSGFTDYEFVAPSSPGSGQRGEGDVDMEQADHLGEGFEAADGQAKVTQDYEDHEVFSRADDDTEMEKGDGSDGSLVQKGEESVGTDGAPSDAASVSSEQGEDVGSKGGILSSAGFKEGTGANAPDRTDHTEHMDPNAGKVDGMDYEGGDGQPIDQFGGDGQQKGEIPDDGQQSGQFGGDGQQSDQFGGDGLQSGQSGGDGQQSGQSSGDVQLSGQYGGDGQPSGQSGEDGHETREFGGDGQRSGQIGGDAQQSGQLGDEVSQNVASQGPSDPSQHAVEYFDDLDRGHLTGADVSEADSATEDAAETSLGSKGGENLSGAHRNWEDWEDVVSGEGKPGETKMSPLLQELDDAEQPLSGDGQTSSPQQSDQLESDSGDKKAPMSESEEAALILDQDVAGSEMYVQPKPQDWEYLLESSIKQIRGNSLPSTSADQGVSSDQDPSEVTPHSDDEEGGLKDRADATEPTSEPKADETKKAPLRLTAAEANWDDWQDVINEVPMTEDPGSSHGDDQTRGADSLRGGDLSEPGQGMPGTVSESEFVESSNDVPVESGTGVPVESGTGVPVESGAGVPVESGADVPVKSGNDVSVESGNDVPVESGNDVPVERGTGIPVESDPNAASTAGTPPGIPKSERSDWLIDFSEPSENNIPGQEIEAEPALVHSPPKLGAFGSNFFDLLMQIEDSSQEQGERSSEVTPLSDSGQTGHLPSKWSSALRNWDDWEDVVRESEFVNGAETTRPVLESDSAIDEHPSLVEPSNPADKNSVDSRSIRPADLKLPPQTNNSGAAADSGKQPNGMATRAVPDEADTLFRLPKPVVVARVAGNGLPKSREFPDSGKDSLHTEGRKGVDAAASGDESGQAGTGSVPPAEGDSDDWEDVHKNAYVPGGSRPSSPSFEGAPDGSLSSENDYPIGFESAVKLPFGKKRWADWEDLAKSEYMVLDGPDGESLIFKRASDPRGTPSSSKSLRGRESPSFDEPENVGRSPRLRSRRRQPPSFDDEKPKRGSPRGVVQPAHSHSPYSPRQFDAHPAYSPRKSEAGDNPSLVTTRRPLLYRDSRRDYTSEVEDMDAAAVPQARIVHHHDHGLHEHEDALKYNVERVLRNQTKYELICPICGALITRKIVIRKKKRRFLSEGDPRWGRNAEITPADDVGNQTPRSDASSGSEDAGAAWKQGIRPCFGYFFGSTY